MGWFNVVAACVVDGLHYVRPTTQPIEVAVDVAAPLVESGKLERYGAPVAELTWPPEVEMATSDDDAGIVEQLRNIPVPEPRPRGRRKATED